MLREGKLKKGLSKASVDTVFCLTHCNLGICLIILFQGWQGHHGRDRMVIGLTTIYAITTKVLSLNPTHGEVYSIQHVIKFVGELRQVSSFLWVLQFPPLIKLTTTIKQKYC
jgi:hypothetical protein